MEILEIDKSGEDILNKDYSIVLVKNDNEVFGYRIPQKIRDELKNYYDSDRLNLKDRFHFKLRFHIACIILLIKESLNEKESYKIFICNDIDGHFHEIKDMVFCNLNGCIPSLKRENIMQAKFSKDSLVNRSANAFYKKKEKILFKQAKVCNFKVEDLVKIIRKGGNQG